MTRQPGLGAKCADAACLESKDQSAGAYRHSDFDGSNVGKIFAIKRRVQEGF